VIGDSGNAGCSRAPIIRHVVDDDGLAHALDLARLEAVIRYVRGHEHHGTIRNERRAACVRPGLIVDVGAEIAMAGIGRDVEQHCEDLDAEVGVRLEPESVGVLRELDPQMRAVEIGAKVTRDGLGQGGCRKASLTALRTECAAMLSASK
jgi:hypothetical protein